MKNEKDEETRKPKKPRGAVQIPIFKSIRGMCFAAILAAMSLILGKFMQIPHPFQEFIRISFENLPIVLAGIVLGPVAGALVGTVADLIGCLLYGYTINILITLGGASVGFVAGFMANYIVKRPLVLQVILSEAAAHAVGSVLIKSAGLAAWYLSKYELGYFEFVAWRLLNYSIVAAAECVILYLLLRNRAFRKQIEEIRGK